MQNFFQKIYYNNKNIKKYELKKMEQNNLNIQFIYGIHPIKECINAKKRKIYELYIDENRKKEINTIIKQIEKYTKITFVKKNFLDKITNFEEHQGIVAYVSPFQFQKNIFEFYKDNIILFCDSIQDTKNLGGLLRSAYCTGIKKIIITLKNSAPISAATLKSSAGLAEHLQIYQSKNAEQSISELKNNGYSIYLTSPNGIPIEKTPLSPPLVMVIGNEHAGIQKQLFNYGSTVSLSQIKENISYNASVAGGIILYHIMYNNNISKIKNITKTENL